MDRDLKTVFYTVVRQRLIVDQDLKTVFCTVVRQRPIVDHDLRTILHSGARGLQPHRKSGWAGGGGVNINVHSLKRARAPCKTAKTKASPLQPARDSTTVCFFPSSSVGQSQQFGSYPHLSTPDPKRMLSGVGVGMGVAPPGSENNNIDKNIKVTLDNRDLWSKFHSLGTEMIITKTGRSGPVWLMSVCCAAVSLFVCLSVSVWQRLAVCVCLPVFVCLSLIVLE